MPLAGLEVHIFPARQEQLELSNKRKEDEVQGQLELAPDIGT